MKVTYSLDEATYYAVRDKVLAIKGITGAMAAGGEELDPDDLPGLCEHLTKLAKEVFESLKNAEEQTAAAE